MLQYIGILIFSKISFARFRRRTFEQHLDLSSAMSHQEFGGILSPPGTRCAKLSESSSPLFVGERTTRFVHADRV